ncbi:hypothetical protein G6F57_015445 [Rhizopus arrhizus]|nr:hypothetical protein G6F31_020148 [Rhizopus arrhizus]KAG1175814.1 hypothetical protein G6F35_016533 [Rhizopus arrhizus]KAG1454731.1 hypothetical protein G6F57_015445 [Rhizopus arrhizus]
MQEAGAGDQEADQPDQAQRRVQIVLALALALEAEHGYPRQCAQHHRQQEGDVAEQLQQHVGDPGAGATAEVVHRRDHAAGVRPARIGR